MDKRNLLSRLAAVFGRKAAEPTEPAPAEAETPGPPAEAPEPGPPADEPRPIGEMMPSIGPETPADERLTHSLDDAVAVVERAGRMLEAQAKQQQQTNDAVSELSGMVQTLTDQVAADSEAIEAIRNQLGGLAESTDRLGSQFNEAAAKLATAGGDSARMGESVTTLTRRVDELARSVAEQGRNQTDVLAATGRRTQRDFALLHWGVLAAIVLAAAAVVAPFVAKLMG